MRLRSLAVSAAGAALIVPMAPAQAAEPLMSLEHGRDRGWGYVKRVLVYDGECDGHDVRVAYYRQNRRGDSELRFRFDENGCRGDNAWFTDWRGTGWTIQRMALQEQRDDGTWSSTRWHRVTEWT